MIFFIRLVTAACFFTLLGKANIWLNPVSNAILAVGYRSFLVLSPGFSRLTKQFAIAAALLFSGIGVLLLLMHGKWSIILGAIILGVGVSVSGYLIRAVAAETPKGAAHNKMVANIGSLIAGLILMLSFHSRALFFAIGAIIFMALSLLAASTTRKQKTITLTAPKKFDFCKTVGWVLCGLGVGIKLFGVFSVLPQFLIAKIGYLPFWYGIMIFINSIAIILFQLPIIHFIGRFGHNNQAIKITLTIMFFGMLLIAFPKFFFVEWFFGALLWTILLSLVECAASYLDVEGSKSGFLLIKETSIGLGGGLTVLASRCIPVVNSSMVIGSLGFVSILIAWVLLCKDVTCVEE